METEKNYCTYERELFALVKACEFFKVFLLGAPFTLNTEHKALAPLFSSKLKTSSRIVKWIMRLQEFTFSIEYIKGSDNVVADALSRIPWAVVPREPNAVEPVSDIDTDSEIELDPILTIVDAEICRFI